MALIENNLSNFYKNLTLGKFTVLLACINGKIIVDVLWQYFLQTEYRIYQAFDNHLNSIYY